jgi:hypothetical protein
MNGDWEPAPLVEAFIIGFTVVFCVGIWWVF